MHIGYLKQGGSLGLDFFGRGTSAGGMWERHVILKGAPALGHKVTIYSPVLKRDLHLLSNYDITYHPSAVSVASDVDLLYIENGPDNYTFTGMGSTLPLVPRMHRLIKSYKGLIIYDYPDILLNPALIPEAYSPSTYKYLEIATAVELFENKGWLIVSKSLDHGLAGEQGTSLRSPIKTLGLPTEYLNLACFLEEFWNKPAPEWELDLVYSGNERPRKNFLLKWYGDMPPDITVGVYGKWKSVEELEKVGILCYGPVSMGHLWELFQKCLAQVYLTDLKFLQSKALTDRAYEIIQGGCLMLLPKSLEGLLEGRKAWEPFLFDDAYLVEDKSFLIETLRYLRNCTWDERIGLNLNQIECIQGDTPTTRVRELECLVEDYIDLPKTQPDEVIPKVVSHINESVLGLCEDDRPRTRESKITRRELLGDKYDYTQCKLRKKATRVRLRV